MTATPELPPLPKPDSMRTDKFDNGRKVRVPLFSEAQVQDYARAYAAEAVRVAQGWRPIETAPKDGSLLLCWVSAVRYAETDEGQQYQQDASLVDFCNWRTQADIPDCGWFEPCCGQIGDSQGVTHWMPLPTPPQADQA